MFHLVVNNAGGRGGTAGARAASALRMLATDARIAARNLARTPRRTLVSISAIAAGVVAMMLAGGFIEWTLWFGGESVIHSQLGHFRVFRPGYLESGFADPYRYLLPAKSEALATLEAMPEVVAVAPRLTFSGLASIADTTLSFVGEGLDPDKERHLSQALQIVAGEDLSADAPNGVVLGEGLAENLSAKPGDKIVLLTSTSSGGVNAVDAEVRGLFATVLRAYDDSVIRLPLALANRLTRTTGAHSWAVVLDDTRHTFPVVDSVRQRLDKSQFDIVPWIKLSDFYNKVAALYQRQFGIVRLIIAAVIVLGIMNTMMMSVLERTSEIGTALAIGRRRGAVLRDFVLEGVLIGAVGGLAGLVLGWLLAGIISAIGIPMPPSPGMSHGFVAGIRLTGTIAVEGFVLAIVSALVASIYPAWRASRMNIVDALRAGR